ncbi:MAG: AsmA family protein [Steroidobacteraceae bacterium]
MNTALLDRWGRLPRRHPVWAGAALALIALLVLLALFDWNWLKGPVQRMVSATTGREFRIDGDLDVDFFPLEVHAGGLYLGNATWSEEAAMAQVEQLDMRVRFWPLLIGRVVLPEVAVKRPRLRIERNQQGQGNWIFDDEPEDCGDDPCKSNLRILQLRASGGLLQFREPTLQTSVDVNFDSGKPASGDALAPLLLRGTGTYRAAPFQLAGQVDSPLALRGDPLPYRVDLTARAGATRARVSGTLTEPLQTEDVAVNFELQGADLADLYGLIGIVLPTTPPYELKGRLSRHGNRFAYRDFKGKVGDSDLAGNAEVAVGGARPKLTAQLRSELLDFDDLAGFIGGTPGTGDGETASDQQKQAANTQRSSGKLLPSAPIHLERLRAMDADVQLTAARLDSRRLPLEGMKAHLYLEDGELILDPMDFSAAGGRLTSTVRVDARTSPARFALAMNVQGLELPKLMPKVKALNDSIGSIAGIVELEGFGDSTAAVMAHSYGNLRLIMGQGRVSNLLMELAGLDIAESLRFLLGKDRQVTLRCAYADFNIADGVASANSVAFDTTDTALLVRGGFSFQDETLDFTLLPKPKDFSPISIRTPLRIGGTFAHPSIGLKGGPFLLRSAAVAALVAVAPPLALLGLLETGPGHDTLCPGDAQRGDQRRDADKDRAQPVPGPKQPVVTG